MEELENFPPCHICGSKEFDLREGFYFCEECGQKQELVQVLEFDIPREEVGLKRTHKLKKEKVETPNLTSWECYNYILRGLVEELLQLGAKEEVKFLTLQLWAAYLRRKEVAFFNKKQTELPRLSAKFLKRDANILYNHTRQKSRTRKRKASDLGSTSGCENKRNWRKSKRQLDESLYSASTQNSRSNTSILSTSTGASNHAIQLKFSSGARKILKKTIPATHLKKHEQDFEGALTCHDLPLSYYKTQFGKKENLLARTRIRDIYTILAIALNLAGDEIQLCDLVRFICEGHLGTQKVLHYFPQNIILYGKEILRDIDFYKFTDKISYRPFRENITLMAKVIGIKEYETPNFISLANRYINELNLPAEMATYVERLINLFPPQMKMRSTKLYPAYEARAMAYIVFVIKLLFGLDGHKENIISESAKKINEEIDKATTERCSDLRYKKLFVWHEWVQYMQMRKIIISQYNSSYSQLSKNDQTITQQVDELIEISLSKAQHESIVSDEAKEISRPTEETTKNINSIMTDYITPPKSSDFPSENDDGLKFQPSFTPSDAYFKRILFHSSIDPERAKKIIKIPEYMRVDHTLRTIEPYLDSRQLKEFFEKLGMRLNVKRLECTNKRSYAGIFVIMRDEKRDPLKADFDISEKEWLSQIVESPLPDEIFFKKTLGRYDKRYSKQRDAMIMKRQLRQFDDAILSHILSVVNQDGGATEELKTKTNGSNFDVMSMASFEIFSENNMEPIKDITLTGPRRELESSNILQINQIEEEDCIVDEVLLPSLNAGNAGNDRRKPELTLFTSKMDLWLLIGQITNLTDIKKKNLENKFSRSFFWLLETCSQIIHVDWGVLYDQLMAIEVMFAYGIEPLDDLRSCIRFKPYQNFKDIGYLVQFYRDVW